MPTIPSTATAASIHNLNEIQPRIMPINRKIANAMMILARVPPDNHLSQQAKGDRADEEKQPRFAVAQKVDHQHRRMKLERKRLTPRRRLHWRRDDCRS
ncbi:hypothetical protein ACLK1S_23540 [Escherichia coli]